MVDDMQMSVSVHGKLRWMVEQLVARY